MYRKDPVDEEMENGAEANATKQKLQGEVDFTTASDEANADAVDDFPQDGRYKWVELIAGKVDGANDGINDGAGEHNKIKQLKCKISRFN